MFLFITGLCVFFLLFSVTGRPKDVDVLRDARVHRARGDPEQGPRHQRRLLVPRRPHVRTANGHAALHRHRPDEDVQHHPEGHRHGGIPAHHHHQRARPHQETLPVRSSLARLFLKTPLGLALSIALDQSRVFAKSFFLVWRFFLSFLGLFYIHYPSFTSFFPFLTPILLIFLETPLGLALSIVLDQSRVFAKSFFLVLPFFLSFLGLFYINYP